MSAFFPLSNVDGQRFHANLGVDIFKVLTFMRFLISLCLASLFMGSAHALPSDEQYEALRTAPTPEHAASIEEDVLVAMLESGSPTADLVLERAMLAEQVGELELARELVDRVLIIKPDFSAAWMNRAMLFLEDGAYDQAILDLNEALTHEPRNFQAWLLLARIFSEFDRNVEALEAYREVLALNPHNEIAKSEVRRLEPKVEGRAI